MRWAPAKKISHLGLVALCLGALAGCSGVKTGPDSDLQALAAGRSYTLTVRSDVPQLESQILYEMAAKELAAVLPIGKEAPVDGEVQVRFSVVRVLSDPSVGYGVGGAVSSTGTATSTAAAASTAPRSYLDGSLLVAVKDAAGQRIWHADYEHNGRFSLAATPEDIAQLSFKRVVDELRKQMKQAGLAPPKGAKP